MTYPHSMAEYTNGSEVWKDHEAMGGEEGGGGPWDPSPSTRSLRFFVPGAGDRFSTPIDGHEVFLSFYFILLPGHPRSDLGRCNMPVREARVEKRPKYRP